MKNVLITGGATGIGKACAQSFMEKGYNVYITYNITKPDYEVNAIKCDLAKISDIENLFNEVNNIDILVNNAGVSIVKMINDTTFEDYEKLMAVNERAVYFCCKYGAMQMLTKHSGAIINISSMWGQCGASCETLYSMSKAGVIGLTKALAQELAPSNITVNCVCPGIIDTRMNAQFCYDELKQEVPMEKIGKPNDIASAVCFFAGNEYTTGQVLGVNGGII